MEINKPLILITNDDGYLAEGFNALIKLVRPIASVLAVAPHLPRSGQSSAVTVSPPLSLEKVKDEPDCVVYRCTGTPVDCVKIAMNQLCQRPPDLLLSGINYGGNSSINILYSGTMGAALEGAACGIPSLGISYLGANKESDYTPLFPFIIEILNRVMLHGLPYGVSLNINFPDRKAFDGIKICRQAIGRWTEEFIVNKNEKGETTFQLAGDFVDCEPEATDTDEWALRNGYVSVVPSTIDMTAYETVKEMNSWFE